MDAPHRIKVKYFVQDPAAVDLSLFAPIFHRWIQENKVEGMLLDVADYKHVTDGPGVVLIGHEADYGMDFAGGRPGLLYDRKRGWGLENAQGEGAPASLADRLHLVFRIALAACQTLEVEPDLTGRIRFKLDEAELTFVDRLRTPNRPEVLAALAPAIQTALDALYGRDNYTFTQTSMDPRRTLAIHIKARTEGATVADLLARAPAVAQSGFAPVIVTNGASVGHA
jgi:hypothetical protein